MNQALQEAVNPGTEGLHRGGYLYKVHDKVMQIRNNYEKKVFNGDIGVVEQADTEERTVTVNCDPQRDGHTPQYHAAGTAPKSTDGRTAAKGTF